MRFWISWWGGSDEDYRPNYVNGKPPPFSWWCSGERDQDPPFSICAVIDAESEEAAGDEVSRFWPEAESRFCEATEPDWQPNPSRFPPKQTRSRDA